MKTKDLKNYGKSLLEMMESTPPEILKEISESSFSVIEKHMSSEEFQLFVSSLPTAKERMLTKNLSRVREKGLNSEEFIHQQLEWAASFSEASKVIGRERALNVFREIAEQNYPKLFFNIFPAVADLIKFEDPFNAFREWFLTMMAANKNAGLFDYKIVENMGDAFQINCTWCAWHETYKQLGAAEASIPVCHADDAFYPNYFEQTDVIYKRSQTLGWGSASCDFRFERSVKDGDRSKLKQNFGD